MNKEIEIFKAHIKDKHDRCYQKNIQTETAFLNLNEQSIVKEMSSSFNTNFLLYGGYDDSERKKLYFLPDYMDVPDFKISLLNVSYKSTKTLSHRDFLGSILGIGLKREKIGDILVLNNLSQIFIDDDIADFISMNYIKVGKIPVSTTIADLSSVAEITKNIKIINDTVMSMRLDSVLASAFSISRTNAVKYISSGTVYVNDMQVLKTDKQVFENDKLIIRGLGKAKIIEVGGLSRKGRTNIKIEKYI